MPPQIQQLLQNKQMLAIIAGVGLLLVIGLIVVMMNAGGGKSDSDARKLEKDELSLATVDTPGKAIEIQALMAREKISLKRVDVEGGKTSLLFEDKATTDDRDRALVTLVQSGLMDKNVGLELFDKGDLTASREEKKIKLIRARNGELARLIRKIDPIQDASVFISMPEASIFKRDQEAISATVQITLAPGERLNRDKVRSIINLLVGSIENLDAKHVSLTDTNGTVYNSVLDTSDELMDKLEERDRYMEQKVRTQLDRLIGVNKYVATVSTYLREAPKEELSLQYDPQTSSLAKSSNFSENMNSQQKGAAGAAGGPVSSMVPSEISTTTATGEGGQAERGYNRKGQEFEYNAGKTQVSESFKPGMIEEITVAVTVDGGTFPPNMTQTEFQTLIARTASPMVKPDNVTVVMGKPEDIKPITPVEAPQFEIPWWVWVVAGSVALLFLLLLLRAMSKPSIHPKQLEAQQQEIEQLRELASAQANQLQLSQQQAQQVLQAQQQQIAQITTQQQSTRANNDGALELKQTLAELQTVLKNDEDDEDSEEGDDQFNSQIRSWIEST